MFKIPIFDKIKNQIEISRLHLEGFLLLFAVMGMDWIPITFGFLDEIHF